MSEELQKNQLLEDFQKYLEQSKLDSFAINQHVDLNTLLSELTALKTEVKVESRQFKSTLETLSSTLSVVEEEKKSLSTEYDKNSLQQQKQQAEIMRNMLLDFVDIYDRLALGADALENYQPVVSLFKNSRKKDKLFIRRFKEGQAMTLKRFEQLLLRYKVYSINCVEKMFDPKTMRAIETVCFPEIENGRVMEELRKGFLFEDQVLRLAEVRVNKIINNGHIINE